MDRETVERTLGEYFAGRDDVAAAWLFGSVARERSRPDSDIDVGVLFRAEPPPRFPTPAICIATELEAAFARRVDVVAMNRADLPLIHRILRDGRLVVEADRSLRVRFEVAKRGEYFDLLPILREYWTPRKVAS